MKHQSLKHSVRKKLPKLMIICLLSFLLSLVFGCQINSIHSAPKNASVKQLLAQHQYQEAFNIAPTSQKESIEKASEFYSQTTIDYALDMLNEDQWKEALDTLSRAREGIIKKAKIDKTILRIKKDEYLELNRARTLEAIRKAHWFNSQQDLYEMYLLSTRASMLHRARLKNIFKNQSELVSELLEQGHVVLQMGDIALAQRTYSTIGTLWMEENLFDAYDEFEKSIANQINKSNVVKGVEVEIEDEQNPIPQKVVSKLSQPANEIEEQIEQRKIEKKALFRQIDQATQRADLVKINNLLQQLYAQENLTRRDQISIDRTESYLKA
ncbi:MAG: hypothetical protein V4629_01105, partial [Pseudomonadota bacterium]